MKNKKTSNTKTSGKQVSAKSSPKKPAKNVVKKTPASKPTSTIKKAPPAKQIKSAPVKNKTQTTTASTFENTLATIKSAAEEKKAHDVVIFDLRKHAALCDAQVICSGDSDRQTQAIADSIIASMKKNFGSRPLRIDGKQSGNWIAIDYGDIMVHIFLTEVRNHYNLDKIWPQKAVMQ